jgi:hypothetical protein
MKKQKREFMHTCHRKQDLNELFSDFKVCMSVLFIAFNLFKWTKNCLKTTNQANETVFCLHVKRANLMLWILLGSCCVFTAEVAMTVENQYLKWLNISVFIICHYLRIIASGSFFTFSGCLMAFMEQIVT